MQITPLPLNAKVCVLSARRYGDAIINANFLRAAAKARPDIRWVIWTKPEFTPLFRLMGFTNIVTSEFPIAGGAPKVIREFGLSLIKAIYKLRKMDLDASIDFIGDTREGSLGYLIAGRKHHSPKWSNSHWMNRLIWKFKTPYIGRHYIEASQNQTYQIIPFLLARLTGQEIKLTAPTSPILGPAKVAFHIFPSANFRKWPMENWASLASMLNNIGIRPTIICSQADKNEAERLFKDNQSLSLTICPTIENLIAEIQKIDLLVGVDSFLIHLAAALDKKTISIVAGNLPNWWNPEGQIAIGQSGGCVDYPCAHKPTCLGKKDESQCIKSIKPAQVMSTISSTLSLSTPD